MDSVLWLFLNMLWTVSSGYFGCAVDIVLWLLWICCGQCLLALLDMLWTVSSGYFGYAVDSVLSFMHLQRIVCDVIKCSLSDTFHSDRKSTTWVASVMGGRTVGAQTTTDCDVWSYKLHSSCFSFK